MGRLVIILSLIGMTLLVGCNRHIVKHEESYTFGYNPKTGMIWNSLYLLAEGKKINGINL